MFRSISLYLVAIILLALNAFSPVYAGMDPELSAIVNVIKDKSATSETRGNACLKLIEMGAKAKPAVPYVVQLLGEKDEILRDYACTTLSGLGPVASAALPALKKAAASDSSNDIRQLAQSAIEKIQGGGEEGKGDNIPDDDNQHENVSITPIKKPTATIQKKKIVKAPVKRNIQHPLQQVSAAKPAGMYTGAMDHSAITALFPSLGKGVPDWVRAGTRLTYYGCSATVAGSGKDWRPDENGDFKSADGQRWSGDSKAGGSGQGYTHFDIVATNRNAAAISAVLCLIPLSTGKPKLSTQLSFVGPLGSTADMWVNPIELRKLKARARAPLKIQHMPYSNGQQRFSATWIQIEGDRGYNLWVYDNQSGVLLHHASSTTGKSSPVYGPDEASNTPSVTLVSTTFLCRRSLKLPWLGSSVPSWIGSTRSIAYSGTVATSIPGSPTFNLLASLNFTSQAKTANWVRYAVTFTSHGIYGAPPVHDYWQQITGPGSMTGLWISPGALAKLQPGQAIDFDEVTGITTSVAGVNGNTVLIRQSGEGSEIVCGYDTDTGILKSYTRRDDTNTGYTQTSTMIQFQFAGKQ